MVLQGLKPRIFNRLNKYARRWVAEVPAILWSLRTTLNRSTGFTPFFLAYGAEAILPSDLDHGAPRVKAFDHDRAVRPNRTQSTCSKRPVRRPSSAPLATNKPSAGTTKGRSEEGYSKSAISCSEGPNRQRKNTSSLRPGKDPTR